jgi:hypothetical protein
LPTQNRSEREMEKIIWILFRKNFLAKTNGNVWDDDDATSWGVFRRRVWSFLSTNMIR